MSNLGSKDDMNIISALGQPPEEGPSKEDGPHGLPARYVGTRADQQDMVMLGKKQVLRVRVAIHLAWNEG